MTLQEISKGICSVSYLCKLEKNDIIPDESYVRAIFERVNIDYNLVGKNIIENGVENAVKAYLANDFEEIDLLYNSTDDSIFNAQNYLIKAFYYLVTSKYKEFCETIKILDNIKDTLITNDAGVLLFLVTQYYIDTYQFLDALTILKEVNHLSFTIDELNWLIHEQRFDVGFYLNDYNLMYETYFKILINNNIGLPYFRKLIVRAKYLYAYASTNYEKSISEFDKINLRNIPEESQLDITYWKLATMTKGKEYVKTFDQIYNNGLQYDAKFVALLLICAYGIGKQEYIDMACSTVKDYQFNSNEMIDNRFIKFMLIFLKGDFNHEYIDFIKEKIIPYSNKFKHHIYDRFYIEHYLDYLKSGSRYKEAFTILYEKYKK
jgi:hypothetical protein